MEQFRSDAFLRQAQEAFQTHPEQAETSESDAVILDAAWRKSQETETDKIDIESFHQVFGKDRVEKDRRHAASLHKMFEHQLNHPQTGELVRMGRILEAIMIEQVELNEWLGPNVNTQQTTDFDDYQNGVDFVAEFQENKASRYVGFAVDATHGSKQTMKNKLSRLRAKLTKGEMGHVDYFRSRDGRVEGRLNFLPKVVVQVDKKLLVEIARLWVSGKQKELAEHPVKNLIQQEILLQLRAQVSYAQALVRQDKPNAEQILERLQDELLAFEARLPKEQPTFSETEKAFLLRVQQHVERIFDESMVEQAVRWEEKFKQQQRNQRAKMHDKQKQENRD